MQPRLLHHGAGRWARNRRVEGHLGHPGVKTNLLFGPFSTKVQEVAQTKYLVIDTDLLSLLLNWSQSDFCSRDNEFPPNSLN